MALTPDPNPAAAPEAPASRRRSVWRRLWTWTWRSLVVLLLLIVLLLAALAWLGTGSGLRWLSSQPLQFGAVHLELQGIRGDVWGDLRIERLQLQSPRVDVHARDLHLRWNPRALLHQPRLVDVRLLSVSTLDLNLPPGPRSGPPKLPQSLALPLELRVARLHIGALRLGPPGARRPLGRFDASLRTRAGQVQLHAEASTPWGQGRARLTLGVARPFVVRGRLQATLHLRGARAPSSVQLDVRPSGSLQALRLQGMASALQTHVRFDAELAPFAALPLRSATIDAKHVDPARIDPKLPTALLDLQLDLQPSSAQRVRGSLKLSNARPGAINTKRLPLLGLQAVLDVQPGQVQVQQILARLPGGGTLSGSASYTTAKRASAPGLVAAPALLPASRPDTQPMAATAAAREDAHATDAAAPGDFRLDLQAGQIDMHALDSALLATRLSGPLHLHGNLQQQTLQARLTQPGWLAELRASRRGEHIDIARAVLQAQGGRLNASGSLDLRAPQRFAMHVVLEHFDPSRFRAAAGAASASYPAADLNLKLQARGDAATRSAQVDLQVQPSRWRGHVFDGSARGQVSPTGVRGLQADLKLGSNSLKARGDFGRAGDLLHWTLDAPALAQIDPAFAGLAQASGTLAGTPAAPSGQFNLRVSQLTAPGKIQVQSLDANGQLQAGAQGQLKLHLKGSGITAGTFTLQRAEVDAAGRLDAQRIALRLRNADLDLSAALAGGYTAAQGWQGSIEQFSNRGRYAVDLLAPAPLLLAKNHLELQHARLRSAGGSLDLASAAWNAGQLDTTGSAQGVDPAYWLALFGADLHGVQSTLRFDADWSLHAANTLSGHVVVARSAGDVNLPTNPRLSLGLSQLRLQLQAKDDALSARFDATGGLFGSVHAEVQTQVSKHGRAWGVDAAAPLAGSLHADLPSIAWAAPLLGPTAKLGGKLLLDMKAAGSVAKPELRGALTGRALAVTLPAEGLNLQGGVLDAGFSGDTLELTRFSMQGGQGRLTASGKASFANAKPQASLQFSAQQLQVLNRPDRQAVVSGSGTLTLQMPAPGVLHVHYLPKSGATPASLVMDPHPADAAPFQLQVQRTGEQLLARSRLAEQQHRGLARRHLLELVQGREQLGRLADDAPVAAELGAALQRDAAAALARLGGTTVGAVRAPLGTQDFSAYLLQAQASKAQVLGLANAGGDADNSIKQANQFGVTKTMKLAGLLLFITDIHAVGLPAAQGLYLTTPWYWNQNAQSRAWAERYFKEMKAMPTFIQAGDYSATLTYLKAVKAAGTTDGTKVMDEMHKMKVNDMFMHDGFMRPSGLMIHDMYLEQVKTPAESKEPWDYYKLVQTIPGNDAFGPAAAYGCPLDK